MEIEINEKRHGAQPHKEDIENNEKRHDGLQNPAQPPKRIKNQARKKKTQRAHCKKRINQFIGTRNEQHNPNLSSLPCVRVVLLCALSCRVLLLRCVVSCLYICELRSWFCVESLGGRGWWTAAGPKVEEFVKETRVFRACFARFKEWSFAVLHIIVLCKGRRQHGKGSNGVGCFGRGRMCVRPNDNSFVSFLKDFGVGHNDAPTSPTL